MIREIIKYKTYDGKEHDTEKAAEQHSVDKACELVDFILIQAGIQHMTASSKFNIVMSLVGDKEKLEALACGLYEIINYGE